MGTPSFARVFGHQGRGTRNEREARACGFSLVPRPSSLAPGSSRAFTLIELLVVMAIIATLLAIALPRYFHSLDKAREAVLKEDLAQLRVAIDQYHADRGKYPDRLEDLVDKKYLRSIPPDPITESTSTWVAIPPSDPALGQVYDIKSGATGTAIDGSQYGDW